MLAAAIVAVVLSAPASADDSDDDEDESLESRPTTSAVEMWPPAAVAWPPFSPDENPSAAMPIVVAESPAGSPPNGVEVRSMPIVPAVPPP